MPQFAGGEFIMNLGELMAERGIESDPDFVPELIALGDFPPGSGLRGIPWVGNVQVFAWRTDVLEELGLEAPPATWDDVLAYAQAITEAKSGEDVVRHRCARRGGQPGGDQFPAGAARLRHRPLRRKLGAAARDRRGDAGDHDATRAGASWRLRASKPSATRRWAAT